MEPTPEQKTVAHTIATNCLAARLRLVNRKIGAIFDAALRPHGIRASQLSIIVAVSAFERITSRQLCRMLHMDSSTFSRALTRLKRKGWLHVTPSGEGKILRIEVTAEGFHKIEAVYPDWLKAQEKAVTELGASTAETFLASGNRLLLGGLSG